MDSGKRGALAVLAAAAGALAAALAYARSRRAAWLEGERKRWAAKGVLVRDPARVWWLRRRFREAGAGRLQVLADFDRTVSMAFHADGSRVASSHGILESCDLLGEEFKSRSKALFLKYYPLEVSHDIPHAEKERLMVEWWSSAHALQVECGLTERMIESAVRSAAIDIRPRFPEIFGLTASLGVPLVVFSAGLANVITEALRQHCVETAHAHVIANEMDFDAGGRLLGFAGGLVHSLNKNYGMVRDSEFGHRTEDRDCVLVVGDSLTDANMSLGMRPHAELSVGLLNDNPTAERLELYQSTFDIVILNDGPADVVEALIRETAGLDPAFSF